MHVEIENVLPKDIEKRSFEIITEILGDKKIPPENEAVVKRVIHTSADFDYYNNLVFSKNAVQKAKEALLNGAVIVTDTNMVKAGINKTKLHKIGSEVYCFISDDDVAEKARINATTRAVAAVEKALTLNKPIIFAIGNAPTALIRIYELIKDGRLAPAFIIGVPVGFVNVVEAKNLILSTDENYIVAKGRKGGSNVAAAIVNAILYSI